MKNSHLENLRQKLNIISLRIQSQSDPYYYNRYEVIINKILVEIETLNITKEEMITYQELSETANNLQTKFYLNHPWKNMNLNSK